MLCAGGMLDYAKRSKAREFIVATETGMRHPLREQNPGKRVIPIRRAAVCQYVKMITLPTLRDSPARRRYECASRRRSPRGVDANRSHGRDRVSAISGEGRTCVAPGPDPPLSHRAEPASVHPSGRATRLTKQWKRA